MSGHGCAVTSIDEGCEDRLTRAMHRANTAVSCAVCNVSACLCSAGFSGVFTVYWVESVLGKGGVSDLE